MMALWTTRPNTDRRRPTRTMGRDASFPRALVLCISVALPGISGCAERSAGDAPVAAPYRPLMVQLPPPATDRIDYDSATRTLTFYDTPAGAGRWMVRASDAEQGVPAGPDHLVPEGADPDQTFVYYRRPGGQASRTVTLAEIQAARETHASQIR